VDALRVDCAFRSTHNDRLGPVEAEASFILLAKAVGGGDCAQVDRDLCGIGHNNIVYSVIVYVMKRVLISWKFMEVRPGVEIVEAVSDDIYIE